MREYEKLIQTLELCLHKLTALKQASSKGLFASVISMNFLLPMVPIFDDLQKNIVTHLGNVSSSTLLSFSSSSCFFDVKVEHRRTTPGK